MSDFRVSVATIIDGYGIEELDWNEEKGYWTLSQRDGEGLGNPWVQNLDIPIGKLSNLNQFFRLNLPDGDISFLINMSPGELVLLHANNNVIKTIYACLCSVCKKHWTIFRWNEYSRVWGVYGRTCEYSWKRDHAPNQEEVSILGKLRGNMINPTQDPNLGA